MGLPEGRKSFKLGLVVLIHYRLWQTDRPTPTHPASQPRRRSKDPAYYVARVKKICSSKNFEQTTVIPCTWTVDVTTTSDACVQFRYNPYFVGKWESGDNWRIDLH